MGGSADISVETSWRCVQLPKLLMIDCGCIFQIQSRLNLHEISAPQATFFVIAGVRPRGALTRVKILLSRLQRQWQTPSWEPLHGRGFPRRRSGTSLPRYAPQSLSQRRSGYKSIEGNCMQMWPSVKLPSFLQFRTVCSIFIQVT